MINFNGNLISNFNEIKSNFIKQLHTQFSVSEVLRFENGIVLFWEQHYFRIVAALRRHRFKIPMEYTMEYLKREIIKLTDVHSICSDAALIRIQFLPYLKSINFLMSLTKTKPLNKINPEENYNLDLFKEAVIKVNNLSNLSTTNTTIFNIGKRYAEENDLNDCALLNDQKNLVETLQGTLYILQKSKVLTPNLESGVQDFAMRTAFNEWIQKKRKNLELVEQVVNPFELQKSEELMVISLQNGGQTITQFRKTTYNSNQLKVMYDTFVMDIN